jgi:hypothetical protein
MVFKERVIEGMHRINLARMGEKCASILNTALNICFPQNTGNFLVSNERSASNVGLISNVI